VAHARAVLDGVTEDGGALVLPDGRFADRAMVEGARRILALAAHTGAA
jgi:citrate lyase subunit beta/citryl-CoA lyase